MVLYRGFIFFPIFIHVLVSLVHFIHVLVLLVHELLLLYGCCYSGYDRNVPYNPIMELSLCYSYDSTLW